MRAPVAVLSNYIHPTIRNRRELIAYVLRTTGVCVLLALAADMVNQMIFFVDWSTALRSWAITVAVAGIIAAAATWLIGRAHHELYDAKVEFEHLSRTDPLTGLPNRRAVFEVAENSAARTMALVIVDIDRFKNVNDTRGHLAGDEVIRAIAGIMAAELGPLGVLGRIGGEEFALVGSDCDPLALAARLSALLRRVAATPIPFTGGAVTITVSAGVALRRPGGTFSDLYAEADRALYDAKTQGRNRVCFGPSFPPFSDTDEAAWRVDAATDRPNGARSVA